MCYLPPKVEMFCIFSYAAIDFPQVSTLYTNNVIEQSFTQKNIVILLTESANLSRTSSNLSCCAMSRSE